MVHLLVGKKIAFIGDSFSAYWQTGVEKNSWTYQLAQKFPQHQYYNYATGGRGHDYYEWCFLDAKLRGIDIIFTNRTFKQRVTEFGSIGNFEFQENIIDNNYITLDGPPHVWYSIHRKSSIFTMANNYPKSIESNINQSLERKSISEVYHSWNDKWYDNLDKLYNFKHIFKLELLRMVDNPELRTAEVELYEQFVPDGKKIFDKDVNSHMVAAYNCGITVAPDDNHWSLLGNTWVLNNFILTKEIIDILS
jgi:hypothetical protein